MSDTPNTGTPNNLNGPIDPSFPLLVKGPDPEKSQPYSARINEEGSTVRTPNPFRSTPSKAATYPYDL